jgi:hypothetical protein
MKKFIAFLMLFSVLCLVGCAEHNELYDDGVKDRYITSKYIVDGKEMAIEDYAERMENRYSEMVHVINVKGHCIEKNDGAWETTFRIENDKLIFWDWEEEGMSTMSGGVYDEEEGGHQYKADIVKDTLEVKGTHTVEIFEEDDGVTGRTFGDSIESETYSFHRDGSLDYEKDGKKEKGSFSVANGTVKIKRGDTSETFTYKNTLEDALENTIVQNKGSKKERSFRQLRFIK